MKIFKLFTFLIVLLTFTGCSRSSEEVWDDTKSASRHMQRGIKSFCGVPDHSRPVHRREDFLCRDDNSGFCAPAEPDFITLPDDPNPNATTANISPGDPGSPIPGIEAFQDPQNNRELAAIFQNIHFPLNSSLIKGTENMNIVRGIADYMKSNPNSYLFIEGHCDERGAEAYNLALGARRSNSVSEQLVKHGIDPQRLFTVSYGKEKPLVPGHDEETWALNRRAQFKIYWQ
jgi:peptidoglycan-associated lipoprotein